MFQPNRYDCIREVETVDQLVRLLLRLQQRLDADGRLRDTLLLVDSTTPNGLQGYSMHRHGRELDAVAFGVCSRQEAAAFIQELPSPGAAASGGPAR